MTPEHAEALAKRGIVYKPWPSLVRSAPNPKPEGVPCRRCGEGRVEKANMHCDPCKAAAAEREAERRRRKNRGLPVRDGAPPRVCAACGASEADTPWHGKTCKPCYNAAYRASPAYQIKLERERERQRHKTAQRKLQVSAWADENRQILNERRRAKRAEAAAALPVQRSEAA